MVCHPLSSSGSCSVASGHRGEQILHCPLLYLFYSSICPVPVRLRKGDFLLV